MTTITSRSGKGTALTHDQLDDNFFEDIFTMTGNLTAIEDHNRSVIEVAVTATGTTYTFMAAATAKAYDTSTSRFRVTLVNPTVYPITIAADSGEFIDGVASYVLGSNQSVTIYLDYAYTGWITANRGNETPNPNLIINGDMVVRQKGASTATTCVSPATSIIGAVDRMRVYVDVDGGSLSACTIGQETSSWTGVDYNYGLQTSITVSGGTAPKVYALTRIEAKDVQEYINQTATFSVDVIHDVGSNINYSIQVNKPTVADTFSTVSTIGTSSDTSVASGSNAKVTFTQALGDCSNGLEIVVIADCGNVTSKSFRYGHLKGEIGSVATGWYPESYATTLAKCQRYYWRQTRGAISQDQYIGSGYIDPNGEPRVVVRFPVEMRAEAVGNLSNVVNYNDGANDAVADINPTIQQEGVMTARLITSTEARTPGHGCEMYLKSTGDYMEFTAELT